MEEKSRFAQILIFWDAVLLGTLIFISLSVKPGLRCLWLHSAMLAECAIGLLILGILTFGKSEPDYSARTSFYRYDRRDFLTACSLLRPAADPSYIFTDPDADHHYLQEFFAV